MYTRFNFKTKKQLKEAVSKWNAYQELEQAKKGIKPWTIGAVMVSDLRPAREVTIFQPNQMFPSKESESSYTGKAYVEGPHYPSPHTWYAEVWLESGKVVRVR